eukprot:CAMPEP_0176497604 /NCGR_PEP_ID=MMETSP0200_2-20121128/11817_1 /TAXON_ID=947934 /ORGANISM="Chaetoceros sp., Strain GSL56" /LENGTH=539 /DNA_ID=CAMNT_0017895637 /DNA_START=130 /DNA_END=1750 /DNA_ORIENTATION=-
MLNSRGSAALAVRGSFLSKGSLAIVVVLALLGMTSLTEGANYYNKYYSDNADANNENVGDDFVDLSGQDFDMVAIMPISCINYMNGHMIKFEMYENKNNFQCHANNLGTFVVSISHYMRAYFNYQALIRGEDFKLPSDAGYLNCVMLQQTAYSDTKLYAKIGCLERETYTSTKLKLHVYTDKQCSVPYDDGNSNSKGYDINGYYFNSKVSFRPPFYSCASCKPSEISSSFSKRKTFWYDDDAAQKGYQIYKYFDDWLDDYFKQDDAYFTVQKYVNNERIYTKEDDDSFYTVADDDDFYKHRKLGQVSVEEEVDEMSMDLTHAEESSRHLMGSAMKNFQAEVGALELFEKEFWKEHAEIRERELGNANTNSYYDGSVSSWNMCNKLYNYGVWCDEDCRSIDAFRIDQWSKSDMFLLIVMCLFMAFMMLLVFAKRVKAYEKASIYGEEGLAEVGMSPPLACLFVVIFTIVIVLAVLKFVNETLVFSVVTCILLFMFMLKLTLFESKASPLLGSKKKSKRDPYGYGDDFRYHGETDNPLFKY